MGNDKTPEEAAKFMYGFKQDHGGPFFLNEDGSEIPFPLVDANGLQLANYTMIAKIKIEDKKIVRVSYLPTLIRRDKILEVQPRDSEYGQRIFKFVENSTKGAFLNAKFEWDGDEIVITEA